MAEMEAAHRSHSMYSYLPRPNCKGCPWMSSFSTTETNSEPLIRYSSSREPFGSKLVIVNFVILEGSVTYSEYVLVFPAHRASASTILRSYRYLFPQKCNVIWTWDPLHSKGDKGVGPWQWDTLSTFHTLPSGSSHPDIALEKTAQGTPEMVTWRNNTLQEWDTTFQHAACTLNERTLCDAIPDRKNTSARYQTGKKKKKKMMLLTIIPNGIQMILYLLSLVGLEVLIINRPRSPGEKIKMPLEPLVMAATWALRAPFV